MAVALGAAAAVAFLAALAGRWAGPVVFGVVLLGSEYTLSQLLRDGATGVEASVYGAGLVAAAELAYWSLEAAAAPDERELVVRRLAHLLALTLGAVTLGSVVLIGAEVDVGEGLALEAAGVAAAVAALAVVAWLVWRGRGDIHN